MFGKKLLSLSVLAAALSWASVANASTVTYTVTYAGSTTSTLSATAFPADSSLTKMDLSSPTVEGTANLKSFFDVWVSYTPTDSVNNALQALTIVTNLPAGLVPVSPANSTTATTKKYFGNSIYNGVQVFGTNADSGGNNDLSVITVISADAGTAYSELVGQTGASGSDIGGATTGGGSNYSASLGTRLGRFGLKFSSVLGDGSYTISVMPGGGSSITEYTDVNAGDGSPAPVSTANANSNGYSFTVTTIPEPASLGVLALGGLALLVRRRKAC
jgi:hypothetical protein